MWFSIGQSVIGGLNPMKKIPRSAKTKEEIREMLNGGNEESRTLRSAIVQMAVKVIAEEALEAAVRDVLGRDYYQHGGGVGGHRNGYREGSIQTAEGEVRYGVPQVRGVDDFKLRDIRGLKDLLSGRTKELEQLAIEMFARGLSTRDIEDALRADDGRSLLSRTAVSEVTEALWEQYEAFATRDLSDAEPLYLFLDGVAERLVPGARRDAILCAWCLTWSGKKLLLYLAPGTKESTDCCRDFIEDMKRRGLDDPILVVTDGAPGLIRAVEECFPKSLRQRCLAHKIRNLAGRAPGSLWAEFKEAAKAAYHAPSLAMARALRKDLVERFEKECPSAVRCFEEDFEACIAHLHCPPAHRRAARTTNLLERLFGEERRRTKVAYSVTGERKVLKMMFAAMIRASNRWRGITISEFERAQLERLRGQLGERHREATAPVFNTGSTPNRQEGIYIKNRT